LPNIEIGPDGRNRLSFTVPSATLSQLMDQDGAALVVHATADDYRTDPSGNSGSRIACGIVKPS
jgi:Cu-Zn family superoxide dismutase